ncbi:MAG: ParB/RepB/Spo0J family partition protein [Clostridia bacterium]
MAKPIKHALGRGLDALLGGAEAEPTPRAAPMQDGGEQVVSLKITEIDPNREQPRRTFDESALSELAQSIGSVGVIQPILVSQAGARYQIVAGERRWRAARMAGLDEVPAIVRTFDEIKRMEIALIENLQRDDLNPIDEAQGVRALMDKCGYTQEAVAGRLGKSRSAVANLLRILALDKAVIQMVRDGKLTAGHARCLVALPERNAQIRLANLAIGQGWSVRQLERICQQTLKGVAEKPARAARPAEFKQLERMARDAFGTHAQLEGDPDKGKLVLKYDSAEDLQRIWDVLECLGQNNL